jgi:DNA-binding GntR family transcriptional regulator
MAMTKLSPVQAEKPHPLARSGETGQHEAPETRVYDRIRRAITERRLAPGTRLVEDQLAEIFKVSRMRIRAVLQSLAREKLVTHHKNRGICVARPTAKEARDVYAARRLLEVALAREVVRAIDAQGLTRLRAHIEAEAEAGKGADWIGLLHCSLEFHGLLAEIVGNDVLTEVLKELLARSALIAAIYERREISVCSHLSHAGLVDLLEQRREQDFADAMLAHLIEIEGYLALNEKAAAPLDLKSVFAGL